MGDSAARAPALRAPPVRGWLTTCAASVASTYALDAIATVAGVALVASGLLAGFSWTGGLLFLAATYGVWAAALHANIRANWLLLEQTGLSSSVLSKAAYELTRMRTGLAAAHKAAAAAGYVVMELAKEAPYYLGAFGTAILSESVSAEDALLFLGGSNLGAAIYEGAVAMATRALLRRRSERQRWTERP